jgi:hypothetical protein
MQNETNVIVKKRKGKGFKILLGIIVVPLIAVLVFVLAVPGAARPYDLGVTTSLEHYLSAIQKIGYTDNRNEVSGDLNDFNVVYQGQTNVSNEWTSEEVTSFIGYNRPRSFPVTHVQIRFNENGTIDAAGQIDVDYVISKVLNNDYTREDASGYFTMLQFIPNKVNVKVNFKGAIENNEVQGIAINSVSILGIPIPSGLVQGSEVNQFIENYATGFTQSLNQETGANIDSMSIQNGALRIQGILPASMEMIKK